MLLDRGVSRAESMIRGFSAIKQGRQNLSGADEAVKVMSRPVLERGAAVSIHAMRLRKLVRKHLMAVPLVMCEMSVANQRQTLR